ncbi:hypothetical protein EV192_106616 [Actinocrispum wychmicini]|uniref:Uncharacterized protein n=1 Tax=Actinocrispum wychmicini TaxID=1213861 RepID=A0A4R2JKP0_9PSEU|nr:hypothetical protein EV192_106616 [Actinocrispum wychmicini]
MPTVFMVVMAELFLAWARWDWRRGVRPWHRLWRGL